MMRLLTASIFIISVFAPIIAIPLEQSDENSPSDLFAAGSSELFSSSFLTTVKSSSDTDNTFFGEDAGPGNALFQIVLLLIFLNTLRST